MAPELAALELPEERASSCASCPMAGAPFDPAVRCCTYHPSLPGFLVGRALRRADTGSERVLARLEDPDGRTGWGVRAPRAWQREYRRDREVAFGRRVSWRCPYWVEGPLSCSIWRDRNAVCRTWHCKHDDGLPGHRLWVVVRGLMHAVEDALARLCEARLGAPDPDAPVEVWAGYYLACAELVDRLEAEDLLALEDPELLSLRARVREVHGALHGEVPDVVAPQVAEVREHPDGVELVGYSPWNPVVLPRSVFVLLAELDGERPWREALERAVAADPSVQAGWVELLWRHGVVRRKSDPDATWGFEGDDLDPDTLDRVLSSG
ncbi:MAG: hypothetical protein H6734_04940 [Alphaproteobacteria bacterium]|nr:hypothetical protein [Alphaproteobacteria bacterium]